jgi:plastocyanin
MKISPPLAVCCVAAVITGGALFKTASKPAAKPPAAIDAPAAPVAAATVAPAAEPAAEPVAVAGGSVVIADFAFTGTEVGAGSVVSVRNDDGATHTVTGDGFNVKVGGGGTGEFTAPTTPGTYDYVCELHASMAGTLVVK